MGNLGFGHLHVHTSKGSVLDGMSHIPELFDTAKELGQEFIAISDHGSMSSLWEAQEYGKKVGVKTILGCEFYWEHENPFNEEGKFRGNGHLLVLAKNSVGLKNMFKMHKWAGKENFYYKPRINWEVLKEHSEGLIITSACLGSEFNQFILNGEIDEAKAWAEKFHEVFKDDFYIELQPNGMQEQHLANTTGIRIAEELGIEVVATNDVHYTYEDDCFPHEVLLAMQFRKKMSDEKRFKFPAEEFWLKSEEEMYGNFDGLEEAIITRAISNTKVIADKCDAEIKAGHYLPHYHGVEDPSEERAILAKEIMIGAEQRGMKDNKDFMADLQYELDIVDGEGYSGYFLIVQDYVRSAKERGELVGDGRGSGAGSKIAYSTGITELPPHEFDLLFERFMAKGRTPDFDVDFSNQKAIFDDLIEKYGQDNVSRIITFGTMTPKAVARRVMGAFDHESHVQNAISKLIPEGTQDLFEAIAEFPELQAYQKKYPVEFDVMKRLQNVSSHVGTHAGGVLIYPNLGELVPLGWNRNEEMHVAGFDMNELEEQGHFKFDILGLETLPVIHGAIESIRAIEPDFDILTINYEDEKTYDMLCEGDVSGIFQISNQSTKVMEQQPRNFRDLIAINALIRPGVGDWDEYIARRRGKDWEVYEPRRFYMGETEGTMTYQEQYLLDAHILAGWGIAYADKHIRKNKDIKNDKELYEKFHADCIANGHPSDVIDEVWEEIEHAVDGGYGFNKSHSASYARTSFQTAYLKCHYPLHFYASLMSGEKTDGDGQSMISQYISECKDRGIAVLPPHANDSGDSFTVNDDGINYRITTIKHVGDSAVESIQELRPILGFDDFLERREKRFIKKNVVTNLIKAGAFDFDNDDRAELLWRFQMTERTKTQIKEEFQVEKHEWDDTVKCEWEKEVLGMYLSLHPMEKFGFKPLNEFEDGSTALQGGEVVKIFDFHPKKDPNNPKMAFVTIDTLYGQVKLVVFANVWANEENQNALQLGNLVLVRGKKQGNDVLLNSVEVLE